MESNLAAIVVFVSIVSALGLVGAGDVADADAQADLYCSNVKSGIWPDYEGTYKEFCKSSLDKVKTTK